MSVVTNIYEEFCCLLFRVGVKSDRWYVGGFI